MRKTLSANNLVQRRRLRAARTRALQKRLRANRLLVHMSGKHAYAQIIAPDARVLASASTAERDMRQKFANGGNTAAAAAVGARLAEKAKQLDIGKLAFDRGGREYAGRVRALAEAARDGGLSF